MASAQNVPPVEEIATTQLVKKARECLEYGRAAEAVPYLKESLVRFAGSKDPEEVTARAEAMYQLGLCYLQTEQFSEAVELFQNFVAEYPTHGSALVARVLTLEAMARQDDLKRMTEYVDLLETRGDFYQLAAALKDPSNENTCRHALVALERAYAQSGDLKNFKRFLPFCDADALSDVGLNLALLEGGDVAVEQERYLEALQLYRLVKTGQELTVDYDRRLAALKAELAIPLPWVELRARALKQEQRASEERRYETMVADREVLAGASYDLDLLLRLAQCYDAMGRQWIALPVFQRIYTAFPESREAEMCRYLAFNDLLGLREFALARDEGAAYVEIFPQGRFGDEVTLGLMQAEIGLKNLDAADQQGQVLLVQTPEHRYLDQVNYLLGYVQFQKQNYEAAIPFFDKTATVWPDRIYAEESTYWSGVCTLLLGQYERAVELFEHYLQDSNWSPKAFAEGVTYRLGMAHYGLEDDAKAKAIFIGFLAQFPQSDLTSEACSMLGDLVGAEGDLELALTYYERARKSAVNSVQLDYAVFQTAKAYELLGRHEEIIALMTDYLKFSKADGRFAEAGLWLSKSWRALGENEKALDACCETLIRYGNDPKAEGLDSLVAEILDAVRGPEQGALLLARAKNLLDPEREAAYQPGGPRTLGLYLTVLFAGWSEEAERAAYLDSLLAEPSFDAFAPLPLLRFAEAASARGESRRVQQAFDYFVQTFGASDRALDMANLGISAFMMNEDYPEALALAKTTLKKYSVEPAAALTYKLAGDALRLMSQYDAAIEMYSELLKVREWRGPLTPEALYWTAVCKKAQGDVEQACAYYQRVYVLYGQYTEWVAKSYAGSIECLRELDRNDEVIRTWREMVAIPEIAQRPEGREAQAGLDALQGAGQ